MPDDDSNALPAAEDANKQQSATQKPFSINALFTVPPQLKRIFDRYPLVTYSANELPARSPRHGEEHVLYIFTTEEDARKGRPSFNPGCLKWQTYLKFCSIGFRTVQSNNHASPSGALPFLLSGAAVEARGKGEEPVGGNKLKRWVDGQLKQREEKRDEVQDVRYEAYAALLEQRIRRAWLYQLYLNPSNAALLHALYVAPTSANSLVQFSIAYQLRQAASSEILKSNPSSTSPNTISEPAIMQDAEEAFSALSELLGEDDWFFGQEKPGLFDASVFAYTQLFLDQKLGGIGWGENGPGESLRKEHANSVRHRERILERYF